MTVDRRAIVTLLFQVKRTSIPAYACAEASPFGGAASTVNNEYAAVE
jgi:hypothetical protein